MPLAHVLQNMYDAVMKYSVKAAARATGITESRLRTWERRYGIPHPGRSTNGRRQYNEGDLGVIRRMASLVSAGVPASEAAEVARAEEPLANDPAAEAAQVEDPLVARVVEAAATYDEANLVRAIHDALAGHDWGAALDQVLFPALTAIGESWSEDSISSANEHFASEVIRRELCVAIARLPAAPEPFPPPVLLACPEDERHDLGLLGLFLLLRERGVHAVYLGADVPVSDLGECCCTTATACGVPIGHATPDTLVPAAIDAGVDFRTGWFSTLRWRPRPCFHGAHERHPGSAAPSFVVGRR